MTDRERFEEWARREGYSLSRFEDGTYYNSLDTREVWLAYQAALAAERKRLKEKISQHADAFRMGAPTSNAYAKAIDWAIQQIEEGHE